MAKLTPFEREMIISGHPDLNNAQVGRLYGVTKTYALQLRRGLRGVKGLRGEGVKWGLGKKARQTASEHRFYSTFLSQAVPLLRATLRAEQEMRARGVFKTKIERDRRERKWRHARIEEDGRREAPRAAEGVAREPPRLPYARQREARPAGEGLLFDSRRAG